MRVECDLLNESKELADFIIEKCTGKSGLVAKYVNIKNSKCWGNALISDLGDYVPFLFWLGRLSRNKSYCKWSEDQVKLAVKFGQMPCGLFASFDSMRESPLKKTNLRLFPIHDLADTIVGINMMYELTGKEFYKNVAEKFFSAIKKCSAGRFIYTHCIPQLNFHVPLSMPNYAGVYLEELCNLYKLTRNVSFLNDAKSIAYEWLSSSYFKRHKLFSFQPLISTYNPARALMSLKLKLGTSLTFDSSMMMKGNTNMLFGLLRFYEETKDKVIEKAIKEWLSSVEEKLLKNDGAFYYIWDAKTRKKYDLLLEINAAVIDVLLEMFRVFRKKKYVKVAENCANFWLSHKDSSGLIPETVNNAIVSFKKISTNVSRLDSQTDFAIVLFKLHEITKKEKYYQSACDIVNGIMKEHKVGSGFCEFVNLDSHAKSGFKIETKFLTLLLKLLLLARIIGKKKIYGNKLLENLIRDR